LNIGLGCEHVLNYKIIKLIFTNAARQPGKLGGQSPLGGALLRLPVQRPHVGNRIHVRGAGVFLEQGIPLQITCFRGPGWQPAGCHRMRVRTHLRHDNPEVRVQEVHVLRGTGLLPGLDQQRLHDQPRGIVRHVRHRARLRRGARQLRVQHRPQRLLRQGSSFGRGDFREHVVRGTFRGNRGAAKAR